MQPSATAPRAKTAASLSFHAASPVVDNLDCKLMRHNWNHYKVWYSDIVAKGKLIKKTKNKTQKCILHQVLQETNGIILKNDIPG